MPQSVHALALFAGSMLTLLAAEAAALPQRTFVSTGGNDANPCSLAAPCRSFGAAIAQTAVSGEIVVLDSGGYGAVVINKSVEIISPAGVYAGVTAGAGTGVQVVSPAQNVALRGLTINGLGTGQFGIDVQFGALVTIERCRIANFTQDGVRVNSTAFELRDSDVRNNGGNGLTVATGRHTVERTTFRQNATGIDASGSANVFVSDGLVVANGGYGVRASGSALVTIIGGEIVANGSGIFLDGSVASGLTRVAIDRVNITDNGANGILANATSTNAVLQLAVAHSLFAENFSGVIGAASAAGAAAKLAVSDSVFERNAQTALSVSGTGAELTVSSNVVTGSNNGVSKSSGAVIYTRQNNTVRGNTNDLVGTPYVNLGGS